MPVSTVPRLQRPGRRRTPAQTRLPATQDNHPALNPARRRGCVGAAGPDARRRSADPGRGPHQPRHPPPDPSTSPNAGEGRRPPPPWGSRPPSARPASACGAAHPAPALTRRPDPWPPHTARTRPKTSVRGERADGASRSRSESLWPPQGVLRRASSHLRRATRIMTRPINEANHTIDRTMGIPAAYKGA